MAMFERALRLDWCAYRVTILVLVANADLSFRRVALPGPDGDQVTCGDGKKANAGENRRYTSEKKVMAGFILGSTTALLWLMDSHHHQSADGDAEKIAGAKSAKAIVMSCCNVPSSM